MNIAEILKKKRKSLGLSTVEVSLISDVSQSMISDIETGKRKPTFQILKKICDALNIDIELKDKPGLPDKSIKILNDFKEEYEKYKKQKSKIDKKILLIKKKYFKEN